MVGMVGRPASEGGFKAGGIVEITVRFRWPRAQDDAAHKMAAVRCVGGGCWGILCLLSARRKRFGHRVKRRENTIAGRGKEKCEEVRESEKAGGAVGRLRLRKSCSGSFFFCWVLSGAWTANELKAAPVAAAGSAEASRRLDAY